jgi:hypothetical protein
MQSYLGAPTELVAKWKARLSTDDKVKVGVVWSGNPGHKNDQNRSLDLNTILRLRELPIQLISLQKDVRAEDQRMLAENVEQIAHFGPELTDFLETAALVSCMDVVVSVDTSVAHLAGALGQPAWIMLPAMPDWRWMLERNDSVWYPSARLFRRSMHGGWADVLTRIASELRRLRPA